MAHNLQDVDHTPEIEEINKEEYREDEVDYKLPFQYVIDVKAE